MKTEIVIKQGNAKILLTPESEFEIDLIEKIVDNKKGYEKKTAVLTDNSYYQHRNHRIEITLIEKTILNN